MLVIAVSDALITISSKAVIAPAMLDCARPWVDRGGCVSGLLLPSFQAGTSPRGLAGAWWANIFKQPFIPFCNMSLFWVREQKEELVSST